MVVYKFGGATTRTRKGLEALVDLTRDAHLKEVARARRKRAGSTKQHGTVLVISAIGHTTRHLLRAAELSEVGNLTQAEEYLSRTVAQHKQLAASLHLEGESDLLQEFEVIAQDVRSLMEGIAITRELSLRTRDTVLSNGERFAATLIEALVHERGLPVHFVDARSVIITDETFGHATPLIEEIEERVRQKVLPRLKRSEVVLIQGFVGATRDGLTTTMGSESSDLTATLLAGALDAEEVVVWKTVAGIFSADPELVPTAKLIKSLSFREAEEIGRRGARILFPTIAHPLLGADCATVVRVACPSSASTRNTTLSRDATGVRSTPSAKPLAIALEQNLVPIRLKRKYQPQAASQLTSVIRRRRERSREAMRLASHAWSSPLEITLLVRKDQKATIVNELDRDEFDIVEDQAVAALSLVLRESTARAGFESEVLRSLRRFHVRSVLPVEHSVVAILENDEGPAALKKLHKDLFES